MVLLKLGKVLEKANRVLIAFSQVATAAAMVLITVDVLLRLIFNAPILGTYEICQFLLLIILYGSFAYIQSTKQHVIVTLLVDKFPPAIRSIVLGVGYVFTTAFAFIWAYGAFNQGIVFIGAGNETALLHIPHAPFYFFEAVCMFFFGLTLLVDTVTLFAALGNKQLADVVATWEGGSND